MSCTLATTYLLSSSAHGYYKPPHGLFLHLPKSQYLEAYVISPLGPFWSGFIVHSPYPNHYAS